MLQWLALILTALGSGGLLGWIKIKLDKRKQEEEARNAARDDDQTDREFYVEENRKLRKELDEVRVRLNLVEVKVTTYEGMIKMGAVQAKAIIMTHCPSWETCPYLAELRAQESRN